MSIAFAEREKVIREFIFVYDEWVIKYLSVSISVSGNTCFQLRTMVYQDEMVQLVYDIKIDRLYLNLSANGINKRHDLYQFVPSSGLCSDWTDRLAEKVNEFKKSQNSSIISDLKVY
jgi:hypothetical protein